MYVATAAVYVYVTMSRSVGPWPFLCSSGIYEANEGITYT